MDLACRDNAIKDMQEIIEEKRKMLDDKYKELHIIKMENPFIETIIGNYDNYYNSKNTKNIEQLNVLNHLTEYLDGLALAEDTSDSVLNQIKQDQHHILHEMGKIKASLNKLTT